MKTSVVPAKHRTRLAVTALGSAAALMVLFVEPFPSAAAPDDALGAVGTGLSGETDSRLMELAARRARLEAEKSGANRIAFPAALTQVGGAGEAFADAEQQVFEARQAARENQKAQINKRIDALKLEVTGLRARKTAKAKELELVRKELKLVASLHKRQLANDVRLIGMEREQARFEGDIAEINADMARLEMLVGELELQVAAVDQEATVEAARELASVQSDIAHTLQNPNGVEQSVSAGFAPQPRFEPLSFGQAAGIAAPLVRPTPAEPTDRAEPDYVPKADPDHHAKPRRRAQPNTQDHVEHHAAPHNKPKLRPKTAHRSKSTKRQTLSRSRLARPAYTIVRATKRGVRAVGRTLRKIF